MNAAVQFLYWPAITFALWLYLPPVAIIVGVVSGLWLLLLLVLFVRLPFVHIDFTPDEVTIVGCLSRRRIRTEDITGVSALSAGTFVMIGIWYGALIGRSVYCAPDFALVDGSRVNVPSFFAKEFDSENQVAEIRAWLKRREAERTFTASE